MWLMNTIFILLVVTLTAEGLSITTNTSITQKIPKTSTLVKSMPIVQKSNTPVVKKIASSKDKQNVQTSDKRQVNAVSGKILSHSYMPVHKPNKLTANNCGLDCHIPQFLRSLCDPLKPYLHCRKTFQESLKRLQSGDGSISCYCIWQEFFRHGRVHKLAFEKIASFTPHNTSRTVRIRLSTLGRECQNFNNYMCDGSLKGIEEGALLSKSKMRVFGVQTNTSKFSTTKVLGKKVFMFKDGWGKLAPIPTPPAKNKKVPVKNKSEGLSNKQMWMMGFGIGVGVLVMIICTFFLTRMHKDTKITKPDNVNEGSLDTGMARGKRAASLESSKKVKAEEREKLLEEHNLYVEKKSTDIKKSGNDTPASTSQSRSKCSNCGTLYDYDLTLGPFSVSTEDTRLKSITKMGESESEGEETKLFHSSLMYGGRQSSTKKKDTSSVQSK